MRRATPWGPARLVRRGPRPLGLQLVVGVADELGEDVEGDLLGGDLIAGQGLVVHRCLTSEGNPTRRWEPVRDYVSWLLARVGPEPLLLNFAAACIVDGDNVLLQLRSDDGR